MRFGLADLDELPSLKEFEQLAQAALGADDGIAPIEPEEAFEGEQGMLASTNPDAAEGEASATNESEDASTAQPESLAAEMASPSTETVLDGEESALHAEESAPHVDTTTAANSEAATPSSSTPEKKAASSRG